MTGPATTDAARALDSVERLDLNWAVTYRRLRPLQRLAMRVQILSMLDTLDRWTTSYTDALRALDARSRRITGWAVLALATLAGMGLLVAFPVWLALNRARTRLLARMHSAVAEEAALRQTATLAAETMDFSAVLEATAESITRLMGFGHSAVVRFITPDQGRVICTTDPAHDAAQHLIPLAEDDPLGRVLHTGEPAMVGDTQQLRDAALREATRRYGVRSAIAAPIRVEGRLWGGVIHHSPEAGAHTQADLRRLERFCELASLAATNAERMERLADQASKDPLTGLANHRTFHERLRAEVERARRHARDIALVVVDIDHFRLVNEVLGHQGGDRVLVELASQLSTAAREGDTVARVGGEKFAWLMPDADSWGAWCAVERVRQAMSHHEFAGLDRLTVSAGVCDLFQADMNGERLHDLADGALYWAKAHGRDLCVRYSPDVVVDLSASERAARLEQRRTLDAVRLLAQAVDARDPNTQRHSERVADLAVELARLLGWAEHRLDLLREAALVHDVGKIGVPDSVLLKPGPLDDDERARMQTHAALGAQMVSDVLQPDQVQWVRSHHERWDGRGYPDGLPAHDIPDGAQVLIVADAFDAMTADRPYRRGLHMDAAYAEVLRGSGSQFPPAVVEAMITLHGTGRLTAIMETAAALPSGHPAPPANGNGQGRSSGLSSPEHPRTQSVDNAGENTTETA
ncbi:MAG: diguanylate cyclase [Thermoleophilia bacterium]